MKYFHVLSIRGLILHFFYCCRKTVAILTFLILEKLSSLYRRYRLSLHTRQTNAIFQCVGQLMHFRHICYSCDKVLGDWLSTDWAHISLSTISKTREISHTLQQSSSRKFRKGKHAFFLGILSNIEAQNNNCILRVMYLMNEFNNPATPSFYLN